MPTLKGILTPAEAAARLGVGAPAVRDLIRRGRLKAIRMGRFLLVREADVARFKRLTPGRRPAD